MSTIADYSVFTKAFLASGMTDFSQLYGKQFQGEEAEGALRAFAVIPFNIGTPLTPREAMNFDWSKLQSPDSQNACMARRVSCRDADGNFIGNIVRVQPGERKGSIRFVAKVAVPDFVSSEGGSNPADAPYNTFVLVRTSACTSVDLPVAVATISKGYNLHKHKVVVSEGTVNDPFNDKFADPLDDVENANYVSFTINHLNGYTSVDFNPDAYATYDDVANALSRGIDGLHIAFDTASGDLKLLDKDGNVLDQANLPIKTDVIIAEGEEGYKYVKTDVKQDIHAAKAWMPEGKTAWETEDAVPYRMSHAALVVEKGSTPSSREFVESKIEKRHPISIERVPFDHVVIGDSTYMVVDKNETEGRCNLLKVKGGAEAPTVISPVNLSGVNVTHGVDTYTIKNDPVEVDVIKGEDGVTNYVLAGTNRPDVFKPRTLDGRDTTNIFYEGRIETPEGSSTDKVVGITTDGTNLYTFDEGAQPPSEITSISGGKVRWLDIKTLPESPAPTLKYGLEAFVWTVKGEGDVINEPFFQQLNASLLALGFHEGDDIALGTNLATLAQTGEGAPLNKVDADEYMHGKDNKATREREVNTQRAYAKEELVAWNAQHPVLTQERSLGTIIDSSGLDVRNGSITLGCGRVGAEGVNSFQKVNYGIQMKDRSRNDNIPNRSESLDFTISHFTGGKVQFDDDGHAAQLFSSTLLSIEPSSYISGAPTCLILAEVTHNSDPNSVNGPTVFTPVRMTAGFSVAPSYSALDGLRLTLQDYRDNILSLLHPDLENQWSAPAIIEVQAIYMHPNAETVPAQQMHTYIGEWSSRSAEGIEIGHPECRFFCNKIEEWMTAIGLADTNPAENVKLYVVIRVY